MVYRVPKTWLNMMCGMKYHHIIIGNDKSGIIHTFLIKPISTCKISRICEPYLHLARRVGSGIQLINKQI